MVDSATSWSRVSLGCCLVGLRTPQILEREAAGTLVGIRFGQGDLRTHAYRSLSYPIVPFPKPLPELCQLGAQRDWLQELDPVTER